MRFISRLFLSIAFSGCSAIFSDAQAPINSENVPEVSFNLSLSRASLTTTEFEQYKSMPAGLFAECGTIHRGRPDTRDQRVEKVDAEKLHEARVLAYRLFERLSADDRPPVDQPGTNASLADPGKYTLKLRVADKQVELLTSLDFVERRQASIATDANNFTQVVRALPSSVMCGNNDFYGIGRAR
jgi:hypothetical protein